MYADRVTDSMRNAIDETERRREIQLKYNKEHNITPETIKKEIRSGLAQQIKARKTARDAVHFGTGEYEKVEMASQIEQEMLDAAKELDFERAAKLRDQLRELKDLPELVLVNSKKKKRDFLATKKQKKHEKKIPSPGN
jgi:excinuclease ABC subunit B